MNPNIYACQSCGDLQKAAGWSSLLFLALTAAGAYGLWKFVQWSDRKG